VTHTEAWSASLGTTVTNFVSSPVVGSDGTIYAGSYDNRVVALNPNGTQKWVFNTAGAVFSTPCLTTDGTIYFSGMDAKLYAIRDNGTQADLLWTYPLRSATFNSPTVDADGIVYVGATGTVYAVYGTAPLDTAAPWPKDRHDLKRTGRYGGF